jgi:hypothetical protein
MGEDTEGWFVPGVPSRLASPFVNASSGGRGYALLSDEWRARDIG